MYSDVIDFGFKSGSDWLLNRNRARVGFGLEKSSSGRAQHLQPVDNSVLAASQDDVLCVLQFAAIMTVCQVLQLTALLDTVVRLSIQRKI